MRTKYESWKEDNWYTSGKKQRPIKNWKTTLINTLPYLKKKEPIDWIGLGSDYKLIREKIAQVFEGFNQYKERAQKGGFDLSNHTRVGDFSNLPGGRASFSVCAPSKHELKDGEFILMTIRSHDQFNNTIYGMDDRYRGIYNERRVVLINPKDADMLSLKKLDVIDLVSNYDGKERRARNFLIIPYIFPKGNLAAYFPEANVLIPYGQFADKSNTLISKSVKVSIEKVKGS